MRMKKKKKTLFEKILGIPAIVTEKHVAAYAAQSAYFFVLSMIPIILLLLTIVRFTPVTKADVMTAVITVFPSSVNSMVTSIVNQVYNQSVTIIPITIIVALWSAGRGVLAVSTGLNVIYNCPETRNYIIIRIRATIYTVLFILVLIFLLVMSVFGDTLYHFVGQHLPLLQPGMAWALHAMVYIQPVVITLFSMLIYTFLPNRKTNFLKQFPGGVLAAAGWTLVSWIFSIYLEIFTGFSSMYGSLTTIVLIMLWLYFCMYSILLGGLMNVLVHGMINRFLARRRQKRRDRLREKGLLEDEIPDENASEAGSPNADVSKADILNAEILKAEGEVKSSSTAGENAEADLTSDSEANLEVEYETDEEEYENDDEDEEEYETDDEDEEDVDWDTVEIITDLDRIETDDLW